MVEPSRVGFMPLSWDMREMAFSFAPSLPILPVTTQREDHRLSQTPDVFTLGLGLTSHQNWNNKLLFKLPQSVVIYYQRLSEDRRNVIHFKMKLPIRMASGQGMCGSWDQW